MVSKVLVFEVRVNALLLAQQFFEGRKLQRSFPQNRWVIAQSSKELIDDFLLVWNIARRDWTGWVTVKQDKKRDLLALELKMTSQRIGNESAERPAEQMIGSGRLNFANLTKVIGHHFLKCPGQNLRLVEASCLQSIDRIIGSDMLQKPRVAPAEACGWMDAKKRGQVPAGSEREDDLQ